MKTQLSHNLMVGLLFFAALAMLAFFTIVSEDGPFASQGKQIVAFFDTAEGIKAGSRVTVVGVPSGLVRSVDLVPVDANRKFVGADSPEKVGQRVALTIELTKELVFYENYSIDIKAASLLGGRIVAIYPGSSFPETAPYTQEEEQGNEQKAFEAIPVFFAKGEGFFTESVLRQYLEARDRMGYVELQGQAAGDPVAGLAEIISENRKKC